MRPDMLIQSLAQESFEVDSSQGAHHHHPSFCFGPFLQPVLWKLDSHSPMPSKRDAPTEPDSNQQRVNQLWGGR
eukprot:12003410-Prorocentrum_lima.AAC.1